MGSPKPDPRDLVVEALADPEHPIQRLRGQAPFVVLDRDHDLGVALVGDAANRNRRACPFAGVVDQIGQHFVEIHRIAQGHATRIDVHGEPQLLAD